MLRERRSLAACAGLAWLTAMATSSSSAVRAQAPAAPATPVATLVTTYCVGCHNDRAKVGGFSLASADTAQVGRSADVWEKVVVKLRSRSMPPAGMKRPDNGTYDTVSAWLEQELDRAALASPNPGRPADLHRLNRGEYANAIRDLLGIDVDAAALLPPDTQAFGFDTNADALSMEPASWRQLPQCLCCHLHRSAIDLCHDVVFWIDGLVPRLVERHVRGLAQFEIPPLRSSS